MDDVVDVESGYERARTTLQAMRERGLDVQLAGERWHADGEFGHLRVRVQTPGRLSAALGIDGSGNVESLADMEAEFANTHRQRWGALGLAAAGNVLSQNAVAVLSFHGWYDRHQVSAEDLLHQLRSFDPQASVGESPDTFHVEADRATLIDRLAFEPSIIKLSGGTLPTTIAPASMQTEGIPSSATDSNSDHAYTPLEITGRGVRVGLQELGKACGIWREHEAFGRLGDLVYEVPPATCNSDPECNEDCGRWVGLNLADPGICKDGRCMTRHATPVASRIASSLAARGPFHAAGVELFVDFILGGQLPGWELEKAFVKSMEWFDERGVKIVNQSFESQYALSFFSDQGDWFARHRGITQVRAAGNQISPEPTDFLVHDAGFNVINVGATNAGAHMGDYLGPYWPAFSEDFMWVGSRWENPDPKREWEEPDLVAQGEDADVALLSASSTVHSWSRASGTSLAAPVVTGLLALMAEHCGFVGSPLRHRSILRTSAWSSQDFEKSSSGTDRACPGAVTDPFYATPGLGCDFKDGAGIVDARNLVLWCSQEQNDCEKDPAMPCLSFVEDVAIPGEGIPVPGWMESPSEYIQNALGSPGEYGLRVRLLDDPTGSEVHVLWEGRGFGAGSRFRQTLSYYSCPGATASPDDLATRANFDLVLAAQRVGQAEPRVVFLSQSFDDSDEGFDTVLPWDADWVGVYLVTPTSWPGCIDGEGGTEPNEPYAWSMAWWKR